MEHDALNFFLIIIGCAVLGYFLSVKIAEAITK
jgi:hypothetical protein